MLLRAVFWIGLVSVLMPQKPETWAGSGPSNSASPYEFGSSAAAPASCAGRTTLCTGTFASLGNLQNTIRNGLARTKTDIEAQERARAE